MGGWPAWPCCGGPPRPAPPTLAWAAGLYGPVAAIPALAWAVLRLGAFFFPAPSWAMPMAWAVLRSGRLLAPA
eukprot:10382621-Alexandrium_andersonii.AAC.1